MWQWAKETPRFELHIRNLKIKQAQRCNNLDNVITEDEKCDRKLKVGGNSEVTFQKNE